MQPSLRTTRYQRISESVVHLAHRNGEELLLKTPSLGRVARFAFSAASSRRSGEPPRRTALAGEGPPLLSLHRTYRQPAQSVELGYVRRVERVIPSHVIPPHADRGHRERTDLETANGASVFLFLCASSVSVFASANGAKSSSNSSSVWGFTVVLQPTQIHFIAFAACRHCHRSRFSPQHSLTHAVR